MICSAVSSHSAAYIAEIFQRFSIAIQPGNDNAGIVDCNIGKYILFCCRSSGREAYIRQLPTRNCVSFKNHQLFIAILLIDVTAVKKYQDQKKRNVKWSIHNLKVNGV